MWVKVCGITNEEDALMAVALGADAIGFVFAASPRQVSVGAVRDIVKRLPPEVLTIGVFRDHSPDIVIEAVHDARLGGAQLHGHETPAQAAEIRPHVKALFVALAAGSPALARAEEYPADAILLDAPTPGGGKVFDWSLAENLPVGRRWILAGGLTPDNVAEAVRQVRPWGVDVSSGVESEVGRKDPLLVRDFVHRAHDAAGSDPDRAADDPDADPDSLPFDWQDAGELR